MAAAGFDWGNFVSNINLGDTLQGIGSLAGAWGQYENAKDTSALKKKQLQYEMDKDALANAKLDSQQKSWDDAWSTLTPSLMPTKTA